MGTPLERWHEETQSAWLYDRLASCEPQAAQAELYKQLAHTAREQAGILEGDVKQAGMVLPAFQPTPRARLVAWLARASTPERIKPMLAALKVRGLSAYGRGHAMPTKVDGIGARHKRAGSGGTLRAAVFGVNDGLVSNASLVLGVAGATAEAATTGGSNAVVIAGIAGMLAGAFSMAAGEWISVRTQTELWEHQIGEEREELERYPEAEAEELALIYAARGMNLDAARALSLELVQDKDRALDALSRDVAVLVRRGAHGALALRVSIAAAAVTLFLVGAATSLFSGRNLYYGGLRMLTIGAAAGAATWVIGSLLGASVG